MPEGSEVFFGGEADDLILRMYHAGEPLPRIADSIFAWFSERVSPEDVKRRINQLLNKTVNGSSFGNLPLVNGKIKRRKRKRV